jgi:hypothetical protein
MLLAPAVSDTFSDSAAVQALQQLYPTGTIAMLESSVPDKNFLVFLVKP